MDVIIAQGIEAGGHVAGEVSTMVLLPRIVEAVAPALVLAAGRYRRRKRTRCCTLPGCRRRRVGTRFLATPEANAHPIYKAERVAGTEDAEPRIGHVQGTRRQQGEPRTRLGLGRSASAAGVPH